MKEEIESLKKLAELSKDIGQDFFMHPDSAIEMFEHLEMLQSRLESLEKDAARWNMVLHHVGADQLLGGAQYVIRGIKAPINVMRGAVSQHFVKSIDTAMQANKGV